MSGLIDNTMTTKDLESLDSCEQYDQNKNIIMMAHMKVSRGVGASDTNTSPNNPKHQSIHWTSKFFSIKYFALMGMFMYAIYIIQVLGPFHYNHHLYSSQPLPPNSSRRRSIILLSHHLYYAVEAEDNFLGDNERKDLREQWHRALHRASVQDGQIESELGAQYTGFDLGNLVRYMLTIGDFREEAFVRPRIYEEKMHVSFERFKELYDAVGSGQHATIISAPTGSVQQMHNQAMLQYNMIDVDPRRPPLVVFESFPTIITEVSFSNIYKFFDELIAFVRSIRLVYPTSLVVWIIPSSVAKLGHEQDEIKQLYHHLILNHLIVRYGVIVVPFMPDAAVVKALSNQLSMIYHHADVYYKLYTNELHAKHMVEFGNGANDAIARLTAINAYLRPLYESEGSITMYDVIHGRTNNIDNSTKLTLHHLCHRFLNTRKYSLPCMPEPKRRYPLLITGLGGSGTHFLTNQLQKLGFRVNHESIGQHGSVSWFYAVNDVYSNLSYPYGTLLESERSIFSPRFDHVIHVIRDPLHQISSFTAHSNKTYNFLYDVVVHHQHDVFDNNLMKIFAEAHQLQQNCVRGESCHLEFAALSWIAWNRLIQRYSDAFFHISDSDKILNHACKVLWHDYHPSSKESCIQQRKVFLETTVWKRLWFYVMKRNFPIFKVHRHHEHYNASNIVALGDTIFHELSAEAKVYGYSIKD